MLVAKIIICILAFVACYIARKLYDNPLLEFEILYKIFFVVSVIVSILLVITESILLILNWHTFTIPLILLFVTICVLISFHDNDVPIPFVASTVISFMVVGIIYYSLVHAGIII